MATCDTVGERELKLKALETVLIYVSTDVNRPEKGMVTVYSDERGEIHAVVGKSIKVRTTDKILAKYAVGIKREEKDNSITFTVYLEGCLH
jgi:hypothetical protein